MVDELKTLVSGIPHGQVEIKRFKLPSVIVRSDCPKCRYTHTRDLSHDYINNPHLNGENKIHFYCDECEETAEWGVIINLNVSVQFVRVDVD